MSDTIFATNTSKPFKRFDVPIKMGLLIGVIGVILNTANYLFLLPVNYIAFLVFTFVVYIACIVLYGVTGAQQRKAVGGYIDIKGAFQAIFIAILISTLIISIWGFIYAKYIDPQLTDKIKAGTLGMMERFNAPQASLDDASAKFDAEIKSSQSIGNVLYAYAKGLILQSIFGFICAAIVRRNPPVQMR